MEKFIITNHAGIKYCAEHAVYPVHLLSINHMYTLSAVIALFSLAAYLTAAALHRREEVRSEG